MACNKLLKEALEGIEFNYKLDSTLSDLDPKQKFSSTQLEGFLRKKGVSPKEIKQSELLYGTDDRPKTISWWQDKIKAGKHKINRSYGTEDYSDITLGMAGKDNNTYKETLSIINKPKSNEPKLSHFSNDFRPESDKTLLGWNRTHVDTINGKKTTVLNEFQSDWAQSERSGRGTFSSSVSTEDKTNIVADFPMSEQKHHQYQIVEAIDQAIKNGTNRIAIPIERETELEGTEGVTKFYDSLNKKILPEIRKKLDQQGMKLNVAKEENPYATPKRPKLNSNIKNLWEEGELGQEGEGVKDIPETIINKLPYLSIKDTVDLLYPYDPYISTIVNRWYSQGGKYLMDSNTYSNISKSLLDKGISITQLEKEYGSHYLPGFYDYLESKYPNIMEKYKIKPKGLHVIDITPVKGKKVKWDVYSVLGSIGLGDIAYELQGKNNGM